MIKKLILVFVVACSSAAAQTFPLVHPAGVTDAGSEQWGCHHDAFTPGPGLTLANSVRISGIRDVLPAIIDPVPFVFGGQGIMYVSYSSSLLVWGYDIGSLLPVGGPGDQCPLYSVGDIVVVPFVWDEWISPNYGGGFTVPADPGLVGLTFYAQAMGVSTTFGMNVMTQAIKIVIQA